MYLNIKPTDLQIYTKVHIISTYYEIMNNSNTI